MGYKNARGKNNTKPEKMNFSGLSDCSQPETFLNECVNLGTKKRRLHYKMSSKPSGI